MKSRITLKQLAQDLGLSPATVSLVLRGKGDEGRINRLTQRRVLKRAEELEYRPNFLARALSSRKTGTIGVLVPDIYERFMSNVVRGIEDVLYREGLSMMLSTSRFHTAVEKQNLQQIIDHEVDGMLLMPYIPFAGQQADYSYIAQAVKQVPTVAIDRAPEGLFRYTVLQDDREGARQAVAALVSAGCRRIGYISFDIPIGTIGNRFDGYRAALRDAGLPFRDDHMILLLCNDRNAGDLSGALSAVLHGPEAPDAFFVTTAGLALRARDIIRSLDGARSDRVMIAKVGQDPEGFESGMITVVQPDREMGIAATGILLQLLRGGSPEHDMVTLKQKITIPAALDGGKHNLQEDV